jgi:capsule polysaccharide export protein KpsE/RkpR
MKSRAETLRKQIEEVINDVRTGGASPEVGNAIARLADAEVRSVIAELKYKAGNTGPMDYFTPTKP